MLPGYGFGDLVRIIELARQVVIDCRHAPSKFREARENALNLCRLLERIEKEAEKPESVFRRDHELVDELNSLVAPCEPPLTQLSEILAKFNSLNSSSSARAIDRFRFPERKILDIRGLLLVHIENLTLFLVNSGLSSIARIECTVNHISEYLRHVDESVDELHLKTYSSKKSILQAVEKIGARNRLEHNVGSVLSDHTNDEKGIWKDLRTDLVRAGFTSEHISRHKLAIKELLADLVKHDLWDAGTAVTFEIRSSTPRACSISSKTKIDRKNRKLPEATNVVTAVNPGSNYRMDSRHISPSRNTRESSHRIGDGAIDSGIVSVSLHKDHADTSDSEFGSSSSRKTQSGASESSNARASKPKMEPSTPSISNGQRVDRCETEPFRKSSTTLPTRDVGSKAVDANPQPISDPTPTNGKLWDDVNRTRKSLFSMARSNLETGMDPDDCYQGHRNLCIASFLGDEKLTRLFLKHSADPNAYCRTPNNPHSAIQRASKEGNIRCVEALLDHGAEINRPLRGAEEAPLMWATYSESSEVVELLLRRGARVNTVHDSGWTALHNVSYKCSNLTIIDLLIDYGADAEILNNPGRTALLIAVIEGNTAIVERLLRRGANKDAQDPIGGSALTIACGLGHSSVVESLLRHGADISQRENTPHTEPLKHALVRRDEKMVRLLLDYGVDPNRPLNGNSSDSYIRRLLCGAPPLHYAASLGSTSMVSILLEKGAKVNATYLGATALDYATTMKQHEVVELFLANGAVPRTSSREDEIRKSRSKSAESTTSSIFSTLIHLWLQR